MPDYNSLSYVEEGRVHSDCFRVEVVQTPLEMMPEAPTLEEEEEEKKPVKFKSNQKILTLSQTSFFDFRLLLVAGLQFPYLYRKLQVQE